MSEKSTVVSGKRVEHWGPDPERLEDPLRWRRPRMVLMSDLFHADVPDEFIARVFAVMGSAERHTFQVLTKRPGRMASLVGSERFLDLVGIAKEELDEDQDIMHDRILSWQLGPWPLQNVWLGTSAENQKWADVRIPKLLETPAAVRFLSCEPLLGPIDLYGSAVAPLQRIVPSDADEGTGPINWIIVGGESGPGARPMEIGWARSLVGQCQAAGVPVFVKQFGSVWANEHYGPEGGQVKVRRNRKGGDPAEWPKDLRIREMPERAS